jgi:GTP-sensing pleiotropic transcriptional regulator CodY
MASQISSSDICHESGSRIETSNFVIHARHDILSVDMSGTWNEDNTLEYVADYKRLVHRYFTREWACVINLKDLDMLLSESFQIETLKALNAWSFIKGMKAVSVVVSDNNRSHLLYQFEEVFKVNHPYATAVCQSEFEASQWLASQGFKFKIANPSPKLTSIAV